MKRISFLLVTLALCAPPALRAQDAATDERLKQLSGNLDDLSKQQEVLRKRVDELIKDVQALRDQSAKPTGNYAQKEDFNTLVKAVDAVDKRRMEDTKRTEAEFLKLRDLFKGPPSSGRKVPTPKPPKDTPVTPTADPSGKVFEYVIKPGDTLGAIVQAYKEKSIKVTVKQIVDANPGLKPNSLKEGQKIVIPAPAQ